ncbi:oxygen-insensitive NADPH nitroreductase [Saccharibacillus sacchari]|uniref:Oxygen-insensitive NADPH nitroreductase n=1 Tax=Saccharibacillus sacchari TaxID=456493 RepID=A0ACC6PDX4_9BACL
MNPTIGTLMNHVSVRAFTEQPLSEEQVKLLVRAAQAASSASFQQAYSIIGVTDPALKTQMAELAGGQPFIAEGGHFFVFCADTYRHKQIAEAKNLDISPTIEGIDALLVGTIDATLAAQNLTVAAESMDLGVCYIGGVRDGIIDIADALHIPNHVVPVFGLAVGYPAERNEIKPRLPFDAVYHENRYNTDTLELVKGYDEETRLYYSKRNGQPSTRTWSDTAIGSLIRLPRSFMKEFLTGRGWAKH